jgi:hypothetical protein
VDRAFDGDTTPIRRVQFWRTPDANYSIPYSFVTNKLAVDSSGTALQSLVSDTDEPIVPFQYRHHRSLCPLQLVSGQEGRCRAQLR